MGCECGMIRSMLCRHDISSIIQAVLHYRGTFRFKGIPQVKQPLLFLPPLSPSSYALCTTSCKFNLTVSKDERRVETLQRPLSTSFWFHRFNEIIMYPFRQIIELLYGVFRQNFTVDFSCGWWKLLIAPQLSNIISIFFFDEHFGRKLLKSNQNFF